MSGTKESNKKAVKTRKERHGSDFYKRITSLGGRQRTRGYFGYLRDTNPQALSELSRAAGQKSAQSKKLAKAKVKVKSEDKRAGTTEKSTTPVSGR